MSLSPRWISVGFGLAVILGVSSLPTVTVTATAAVGTWDAAATISPAGSDAGDVSVVTTDTSITAAWTRSVGSNQEIQAAASGDRGTTWSVPVTLSASGTYAENPQLVSNGTTVTAAWSGQVGEAIRVQAASSTDGGLTWSSPSSISAGQYDQGLHLTMDGDTITAVWENSLDGAVTRRIYAASSTDGGLSWSSPKPVSTAGQNAYSPVVATRGSIATVAWSTGDGASARILVSSSTDGGGHWSTPATLSHPSLRASEPRLLVTGSSITALWSAYGSTPASNNRIQAASSSDGGFTWSAPKTLSDTANQTAFALNVATDGTIITAVWTATGAGYYVMSANSADGGSTWSNPVVLSAGSQTDYQAQIVSDSTTTTVVWVRLDGAFYHSAPDSPLFGGTYRTQSVSSNDGGVTWTSPVTVSTVTRPASASNATPAVTDLQLATDGDSITAAWLRFDGGVHRVQVASLTPTTRIAGPDRFSTSAAVAREFDSAATVYVANGRNYPDALSAAPAAGFQNAPLLLTEQDSLPAVIAAEIRRLRPSRIVVVGGPAVVSPAVASALEALYTGAQVVRLAGANRFETSRVVSEDAFGHFGAPIAVVATGTNFPDALSASAAAGTAGGPVILVPGSGSALDSATSDLLEELGATSVYIAGGSAVVSSAIEADLADIFGAGNVQRLAGANRYATAVAINAEFFSSSPVVYLAVGTGYADALSGAALAGKNGAPLYVIPGSCVPTPVLAAIGSLGATRVVLFGGTSALSDAVAKLTPCA